MFQREENCYIPEKSLSIDYIVQFVLLTLCLLDMHLVDGAIHPLNNWAQWKASVFDIIIPS